MQRTEIPEITRRPLDAESAAILHRLTAGLADPAGFGLIAHEIGDAEGGAPTVGAERLSADRYVVTRYIEVDTRTEEPELNDRVAAPEVEFVRQGADWFPVAVRRGRFDGGEHDPHALATALLCLLASEQAELLARGLDWPNSPGIDFHRAARAVARAGRSRSSSRGRG